MQRNRQVKRLLSIARDLAAAPQGLFLDDLAGRHGVTRRTIERDLEGLAALGHEVETVPDEASSRLRKRLVGAVGMGGVAVTAAEMAAARAAGKALASVAAGPVTGAFNILVEKLEQAQPPSVRVDAAALSDAQAMVQMAGTRPAADATVLAVLQEAILSCAELRITYRKGGGEAKDYIAEPYGILLGGRNYLVWRGEDGGYRKFTLRHIDRAEPTGRRFNMDDDFSMTEYALQNVGVMTGAVMDIVLRVSPEGRAKLNDFSFHVTQNVEEQPDGWLIVTFRAAGVDDICNAIFGFGFPVEVQGPEMLAAAYKAKLQAALAACA